MTSSSSLIISIQRVAFWDQTCLCVVSLRKKRLTLCRFFMNMYSYFIRFHPFRKERWMAHSPFFKRFHSSHLSFFHSFCCKKSIRLSQSALIHISSLLRFCCSEIPKKNPLFQKQSRQILAEIRQPILAEIQNKVLRSLCTFLNTSHSALRRTFATFWKTIHNRTCTVHPNVNFQFCSSFKLMSAYRRPCVCMWCSACICMHECWRACTWINITNTPMRI